jgi:hypothetical protein
MERYFGRMGFGPETRAIILKGLKALERNGPQPTEPQLSPRRTTK